MLEISFKTNFVELYTHRVNNNKAELRFCKKAMQYYFHFDGVQTLYRWVHFYSRYSTNMYGYVLLTVKKAEFM